ncbi:chemotaxis protein CheX [Desulfogranum mediterraneum]|uniref:chemotaxis protein CheX n=1 Tax=Desulfogranum mediterraneum TaxID=160661 RepID=UPI0004248677|nr:chemotaxis protein CheX [Desulfogranum mediterraneum]
MTEDLAQYLVDSTLEVFSTMIFLEIEPGEVLHQEAASMESELTSLIGLAGDLRGVIGVHCTRDAAQGITAAMLGMEIDELNEDVKDAIGEIANMVAGGLKVALAGQDVDVELAIPTTVIGTGLRTSGLAGGSRFMIPFTLPVGVFGIELKYVLS